MGAYAFVFAHSQKLHSFCRSRKQYPGSSRQYKVKSRQDTPDGKHYKQTADICAVYALITLVESWYRSKQNGWTDGLDLWSWTSALQWFVQSLRKPLVLSQHLRQLLISADPGERQTTSVARLIDKSHHLPDGKIRCAWVNSSLLLHQDTSHTGTGTSERVENRICDLWISNSAR